MNAIARRLFEFSKRQQILTTVVASSVEEAWAKVEEQDRLGLFPRTEGHDGPLAPYLRGLEAWALLTIVERDLPVEVRS